MCSLLFHVLFTLASIPAASASAKLVASWAAWREVPVLCNYQLVTR
jgi:hypothetical protein